MATVLSLKGLITLANNVPFSFYLITFTLKLKAFQNKLSQKVEGESL